jgi:6-phosphogluconolactonase/glucosamine-6-phosphate isomerase/deaminase
MAVQSITRKTINRRIAGNNVWLEDADGNAKLPHDLSAFDFDVLPDEEAVGQAMFAELTAYSKAKDGDIVIILLGGRGAQAMYKIISRFSQTDEIDDLLSRLHVFTQDALAPMRADNGLSFVRDFERLLGERFFAKIKSFTPMNTETDDLEGALVKYLEKLESLGGIDIFFLGFGPEPEAASHLCYIKPNSGARFADLAGIIPISPSILEHHINKFKVGGSSVSTADEAECRSATSILTLGPAAILGARKIVQSIVDASTAPGKIPSFKRFLETELSENESDLAKQCDENPGLWLRLHPNVKSFVLPDLLSDPSAVADGLNAK